MPQEQEEALEAVEAVLLAEQAPVPVESLPLAVLLNFNPAVAAFADAH